MFNKKIKRQIESVKSSVKWQGDKQRDDYWSLRHDLDRLIEALGLVKQKTHRVEYVKKGGPEPG